MTLEEKAGLIQTLQLEIIKAQKDQDVAGTQSVEMEYQKDLKQLHLQLSKIQVGSI